jgi:hypothetical protein
MSQSRFLGAFLSLSAAVSLILCDQLCVGKDETKPPIGYVLYVRGGWMANSTSSRLLQLGEPVYAGQVVRAFSNKGPWAITIAFLDGSNPVSHTCGPDCSFDVNPLPSDKPADNLATKLVKAVQHLLEHQNPERVFIITRGVNVEEAVLQLDQTDKSFGIDVGTAMKNIPEGQYIVEFTELCPAQPTGSPAQTFKYTWTPNNPVPLSVSALVPGVYKFRVATSEGEQIGSPVAVLIAPAKSFQQAASDFKDAVAVESQWKTVDSEGGHYFLTAYLYVLAQCSGGQ